MHRRVGVAGHLLELVAVAVAEDLAGAVGGLLGGGAAEVVGRQVHGHVGGQLGDDRAAHLLDGTLLALSQEAGLDVGAELGEGGRLARGGGECIVDGRDDPLLDLVAGDGEAKLLAGKLLDGGVGGEREGDLAGLATGHAGEAGEEGGEEVGRAEVDLFLFADNLAGDGVADAAVGDDDDGVGLDDGALVDGDDLGVGGLELVELTVDGLSGHGGAELADLAARGLGELQAGGEELGDEGEGEVGLAVDAIENLHLEEADCAGELGRGAGNLLEAGIDGAVDGVAEGVVAMLGADGVEGGLARAEAVDFDLARELLELLVGLAADDGGLDLCGDKLGDGGLLDDFNAHVDTNA